MKRVPMYMPVVRAAQYLANIQIEQDFNSELCNAIFSFFDVDFVAVATKDSSGEIVLNHRLQQNIPGDIDFDQKMIFDNVLDVLDTGLVKEEEMPDPANMILYFIPVEVEKQPAAALIIGHKEINLTASKSLLNEYLAVARLAGTIKTRIIYEYENTQRKSDEKFRVLFDSSDDPILLLNESGQIIECNEATMQMLGEGSKDNICLRRFSHFAPKCQSDGLASAVKEEQLLQQVEKTGIIQFEWVVLCPEGTKRIVDVKLSIVLLDGCRIKLVHMRDITERKRFEEQLKYLNIELEKKMWELQDINATLEEEIAERQVLQDKYRDALEELSGIFENTADAICKLDVDGRLIQANKGYEQVFGGSIAEALGKRVPTPPDTMHHIKYLLETVSSGGIIKDFETTKLRKDGSRVEISVSMSPIFGANGKVKAMTTIARDITEKKELRETAERERKHHEEQLKHYAAELTETNKELKSFANIVAHDFRAPMVNLKGFSQELGDSLDDLKKIVHEEMVHLPEEIRKKLDELLDRDVPEALRFIHSSVDRLDRMVAALLRLARLGRREMIYKEVDMSQLIKSISQSFYHQIEEKNIRIEIGPMPRIETDLLAMEQIISNLLDNAIKYLEPGRPGEICIGCTDDIDEYIFSIRDNGRGIAAGDQEKIFEIFRRIGTQDVPGEGMGLAYVKTLIRQLDGQVWCESEPGIGTKMNFTVPKHPFRD